LPDQDQRRRSRNATKGFEYLGADSKVSTVQKMRRALEAAGIQFIDEDATVASASDCARACGCGARRGSGEGGQRVMTTTADDIARIREMLKAELEEAAEWRRRKAVEYPDDRRNRDSATEYDRLAKTVKDIPDDLLVAYSEAFEDAPDSERWEEMLKDIFRGFSDFANATELVQAFLDAKREDAEDEDERDAESLLVRSLRATLEQHDVPPNVADKVIGLIQEWEKASSTKS
jgi:hypothetical protein